MNAVECACRHGVSYCVPSIGFIRNSNIRYLASVHRDALDLRIRPNVTSNHESRLSLVAMGELCNAVNWMSASNR